jgi:hypothetical protein
MLGVLIWYSVPPHDFATKTVNDLIDELGLDPGMKVRPESAAQAFRRLRSRLDEERHRVDGAVVRCVDNGRRKEERKFFLEISEGRWAGRQLGYAKFFYPNPRKPDVGTYMHVVLDPDIRDLPKAMQVEADALRQLVLGTFDHLCGHMETNKVRSIVRTLLRGAHGVPLEDSFFFVHASKLPQASAAVELLRLLGCPVHMLPQPDGEQVRSLVLEMAEGDLVRQLEWCTAEVDRTYAKRTRGVTVTAYNYIRGKFQLAMDSASSWSLWLDEPLSATANAALGAYEALERLRGDAR